MTRMSHLRLFSSWTRCDSSMDVQGDYDPCDASGFIRINAVRQASARPAQNASINEVFPVIVMFSALSPQTERTPPPAGFVQGKKIKEDDTDLLPYRDPSSSLALGAEQQYEQIQQMFFRPASFSLTEILHLYCK